MKNLTSRWIAVLFCAAMLTPNFVNSQATINNYCGTDDPTAIESNSQFNAAKQVRKKAAMRDSANGYEIKLVPVTYHVFQDDDGSNGITVEQIEMSMARVNAHFREAGIEFYQCGAIKYYQNTALNDWDKYTDDPSISGYHVANTLNIYFAKSVTSTSGGICGYAYYPGSNHYTVMKNSCAYNGTTFEHELGHYYNLPHTHNTVGGVLEIVARPASGKANNCATAGDFLCGTEADPGLSGKSLTDCVLDAPLGNGPNGDPYVTDPKNIMGYAGTKSCRSVFSHDQLALMNYTVHNNQYRNSYTCPDAPVADFSSDKVTDCIQSTVQFFEETTGNESKTFLWTFEGGNPASSTEENPTVSYVTAGQFDVTLQVTSSSGTDTKTLSDFINITYPISLPYTQDFSAGTNIPNEIATETSGASVASVSSAGGQTDNGLMLQGTGGIYHTFADTATTFVSNPNYTAIMKLSCINATQYSSLTLNFDYKPLFDDNKEYTSARILINGSQVGNYIQPASANEEAWTAYTLDLTPYVGAYIDFALEVNSKSTDNGLYVDNINITGTLAASASDDAGILSISAPTAGANYCGGDVTPNVQIKNYSSSTLNTVNVYYSVDGVTYPVKSLTGLSLATGATESVDLDPISGLGIGQHSFKAYTNQPNSGLDTYALNDTAITSFSIGGGLSGLTDFESESTCNTSSDCEATICPLAGDWTNIQDGSDDIDWRVDKSGTPSSDTGPSGDHTLGSGNYIYTEASSCSNKTAILKSNCIDLSRYSSASLSFWHHMYGSNMGTLSIDVIAGGVTSADVFSLSSDQGDQWSQSTVDLAAFVGNSEVYILFKGMTGNSYRSDIALDDINLTGELEVDTSVTLVGDQMICQGDQSTLVAVSNSDYTYQWYKNGGAIAGATTSSYTVTETGAYYVAVSYQATTKNSNERTITVDICTSVQHADVSFVIYPNPANKIVNVSTQGNTGSVMVLGADGKVVASSNSSSIDVSELQPGIYFITVSINGSEFQEKLMVE